MLLVVYIVLYGMTEGTLWYKEQQEKIQGSKLSKAEVPSIHYILTKISTDGKQIKALPCG